MPARDKTGGAKITTNRNGVSRKAVPVALGLAFALALAGCDNGTNAGNLVRGTLHLSGQQVYEDVPPAGGADNPVWERFLDNRMVTFGGAEGTIANGWLDFKIGTPDNLGNIRDVLNDLAVDVRLGDKVRLADWGDIRVSSGNVRAAWLSLETDEGEAIRRSFSVFGDSEFHGIRYIFVDRNVTITAAGNQKTYEFLSSTCDEWYCDYCGECPTQIIRAAQTNWNAFSIALMTGWNVMGVASDRRHVSDWNDDGRGAFHVPPFTSSFFNSITFDVLAGDHAYARWVLVEDWWAGDCDGCCDYDPWY